MSNIWQKFSCLAHKEWNLFVKNIIFIHSLLTKCLLIITDSTNFIGSIITSGVSSPSVVTPGAVVTGDWWIIWCFVYFINNISYLYFRTGFFFQSARLHHRVLWQSTNEWYELGQSGTCVLSLKWPCSIILYRIILQFNQICQDPFSYQMPVCC